MSDPLDQPAIPAPSGEQSNLINPPSEAYFWIVTVVASLSLATPMVFVRMYVSLRVTRDLRWDDCSVFFSWLLLIAYSGIGLDFINYGALVDIWNVKSGAVMKWRHRVYFEELIYSVFIFTIKLSVLVLYKRVFVPTRAKRNWIYFIIMTVIAFNALFYTANTLVHIFACIPTRKVWDISVPGKCVNGQAVILAAASLNAISDFFIAFIPVAVVQKLHMPRKRKAEIVFIFACGTLCFASSIVHLAYAVLNANDTDETMTLMKVSMWTFGETTSCFLASCVPMVPRLIRHVRGKNTDQTGDTWSKPTFTGQSSLPREMNNPCAWSPLSTAEAGRSDEEDPYLMMEEPSADIGPRTASGENNGPGIMVTKTVDITVAPRCYTQQ